MRYVLQGSLRGRISPDDVEPLGDATVKLYHLPPSGAPEGVRDFRMLPPAEEREKEYLLFAQARTDAQGEFVMELEDWSTARPGFARQYSGQPVQIDVVLRSVPGRRDPSPARAVQVALGVIQPEWKRVDERMTARWSRVLSAQEWGAVRGCFDAWVVCGRVVSVHGRVPRPNLRVSAFDADFVRDDSLGSAVTDGNGKFRIDFATRDFRRTVIPGVDFEVGGPEFFFRVESEDGRLLVDERRAPGVRSARGSVDCCFFTELTVEPEAS